MNIVSPHAELRNAIMTNFLKSIIIDVRIAE
jgi:hypothetical protein